MIEGGIILTVLEIHKGKVRLGIEAPDHIRVVKKRGAVPVKGLGKSLKKEEIKNESK